MNVLETEDIVKVLVTYFNCRDLLSVRLVCVLWYKMCGVRCNGNFRSYFVAKWPCYKTYTCDVYRLMLEKEVYDNDLLTYHVERMTTSTVFSVGIVVKVASKCCNLDIIKELLAGYNKYIDSRYLLPIVNELLLSQDEEILNYAVTLLEIKLLVDKIIELKNSVAFRIVLNMNTWFVYKVKELLRTVVTCDLVEFVDILLELFPQLIHSKVIERYGSVNVLTKYCMDKLDTIILRTASENNIPLLLWAIRRFNRLSVTVTWKFSEDLLCRVSDFTGEVLEIVTEFMERHNVSK